MQIAIVGFGTMGKLVSRIARDSGHIVQTVIDPFSADPMVTSKECTEQTLRDSEVIIEFAASEGILDRLDLYGKLGIPAVIATTGWYDRMPDAKSALCNTNCAIIWSGNFSLGVQLFLKIARNASMIFNRFPIYDPLIQECFHAGKADSPSGTAIMLGNILLEELERKNQLETGRLDRKRADSEIHVSSTRGGSIPGTHTLVFDSPVDTIEITHRARNREGFAYGALQAATWISSGRRGFFSLDDMLTDLIPR
ncbi:MAG: 4-hydroxy-tetrahydrodipicolinate reductase [Spirochaetae bacterium HGW-Spirochaetae-8]|nr:MAG: 4-hydroxy-tetrahydrodipicolinate reductase [Spirochaetae bacterium HGW-Spirochaetae-8]